MIIIVIMRMMMVTNILSTNHGIGDSNSASIMILILPWLDNNSIGDNNNDNGNDNDNNDNNNNNDNDNNPMLVDNLGE